MAKSFDQYLAETGRQSELDDLRRNFKYDAAKSEYDRTGSYGSSNNSIPGSSVNFSSILDQVKNSISGALSPIVDQIKGQAPAITQAYQGAKNTLETQKSSLAGKYQQLLADIKNAGQRQTEGTTKTVNNELARRGITSDSTAAQQELSSNLNPIQEATLSKQAQATSLQGEEEANLANAIAQLGISEQGAQQGILDRVASILSGGVSQATGLAGNVYSQMLGAEQAGKQTDAQKLYADLQNQLLSQQLSSAQSTQPLELQKLQAQISQLLKSSGSGSGLGLNDLDSLWDF